MNHFTRSWLHIHYETKTAHHTVWSDDMHDRVHLRKLHMMYAQTAPPPKIRELEWSDLKKLR